MSRRVKAGFDHRRGSIYILVLSVSMLVSLIGVTAIYVARLQHRIGSTNGDIAEARMHARSAVDIALHKISMDSNWRITYGNTNWPAGSSIDDGTYTITVLDPVDGDVQVGDNDPMILTGIGMKGDAIQKLQVTLEPDDPPLEVLGTSLHCTGDIQIPTNHSLTLTGATASTDKTCNVLGVLYGDIDAASVTGTGTVTGVINTPAPPKSMPASTLFDEYVSRATTLAPVGNINTMVLAPGVNEYGGPTNNEGVYHIDTGGVDIRITLSRIHGTLLIDAGAGKVIIKQQVFMHNYNTKYPVLIVKGDLELTYTSIGIDLQEDIVVHNFNPPGAPYNDQADGDQLDDYPNEIQGLIHVTGVVTFAGPSRIRGAVICDGTVNVMGNPEIIHDPELLLDPPLGYTVFTGAMQARAGTWQQAVGP